MALPTVSDNLFPKIILRESADDGSDFSNPSADYRVIFLGEDGQLHARDSAGTVTDLGGAGVPDGTDPGDLLVWDGDSWAVLAVGNDDETLVADSGEALGVKWAASSAGATSPILSRVVYDPGSDTTYTITSGSLADVDATNLTLPDFDVPASGEVEWEAAIWLLVAHQAQVSMNMRDGSGNLAGSDVEVAATGSADYARAGQIIAKGRVTGLTPAATMTGWRLGCARIAGTGTVQLNTGPRFGPIILKVLRAE